jgi:hypothetical protein
MPLQAIPKPCGLEAATLSIPTRQDETIAKTQFHKCSKRALDKEP